MGQCGRKCNICAHKIISFIAKQDNLKRRGKNPHSASEDRQTLWTVQSPFGLFLPQLIVSPPSTYPHEHHHLLLLPHTYTRFSTFGCLPRAVIASTVSVLLYLYPELCGCLHTNWRACRRKRAGKSSWKCSMSQMGWESNHEVPFF